MFLTLVERTLLFVLKAFVALVGILLTPLALVEAVLAISTLPGIEFWFRFLFFVFPPLAGIFVGAVASFTCFRKRSAVFEESAPEALIAFLGCEHAAEQFQDQRADYCARFGNRFVHLDESAPARKQYTVDCYKLLGSCLLYGIQRIAFHAIESPRRLVLVVTQRISGTEDT